MGLDDLEKQMISAYDERAPHCPDELEPHSYELLKKQREVFAGRDVLEVACGGGSTLRFLSPEISSGTGIDTSPNRIAFCIEKHKGISNITFVVGNAYKLENVPGHFNAAHAGAWFSHVPSSRYDEFLDSLHTRVGPDVPVFLADEAENHENAYQKNDGPDFYKRGRLKDGAEFEIVDNTFSKDDYERIFSSKVNIQEVHIGEVWTWIYYRTR